MKLLFVVMLLCLPLNAQHRSAGFDLAERERAFSAASDSLGVKESFLLFLSDDCTMLDPRPVNGKTLYESKPAGTSHLTWFPLYVEVSASGNFGISTGPWEFRRSKTDTALAFGHYFSVWEKDADGVWKVIFDNGISHPRIEKIVEERNYFQRAGKKSVPASGGGMQEMERRFQEAVRDLGIINAYQKHASPNLRLYRNGSFPSKTPSDAAALIQRSLQPNTFTPLRFRTAESDDIGFTYGYAVSSEKDSASFMRVWHRDGDAGEWTIIVDMLEPFAK